MYHSNNNKSMRHNRLTPARAATALAQAARRATAALAIILLTATTAGAQETITGLTYNSTDGYYEISDAQDLVDLATYVNANNNASGNNASGKTFKQTQDIDMSSISNFTPIGSQPNNYNPTPFNGTYDGQGYAIIGLTVNTESPIAGLFGYMNGGSVRNLTMVNPNVNPNVTSNDNSQSRKYAGGIVGAISPGTIKNCNVINPTLIMSSENGQNIKGAICGGITDPNCAIIDCYYYTTNYNAVGYNALGVAYSASRTYTLTLNDGITTSTAPAFSYGGTEYYAGTITLAAAPMGWVYEYSVNGSPIDGNTFDISGNATVSRTAAHISPLLGYDDDPLVDGSAEHPYTIKTTEGWDLFCDLLADNTMGYFSGKTVRLDADITVTRMAGGENHAFTGTFDGGGHTLTLAYGTADAPVDAQFVAPFVETASGTSPVFRNLTISGTIYATHTAATDHDHVGGLIGHLFGTVTIEHCVSRVEIHAKGGAGGFVGLCEHSVSFTDCHSSAVVHSADGSNSGFVAWSRDSKWNINFTGCLFDGKLLQQNGSGSYNGGFIGWKGDAKIVNITNCLCAPATLADGETMASSNSATFSREHSDYPATIKNSYYTQSLGAAQGKQARAVTAGTDVTVAHAGVATHYATSGITVYKATGASTDSDPFIAGLLYNNNVVDVLYAGSDEVVSLTLSNTATGDAPDGYQYGYTTNAGTLEGSTLTMPDEDVTVSVNTDVLVAIDWATVSTGADKDNAYIIYNKDQLDLLAYRVNGTHGETAVEDGYSGKYFQLAKDISYPHKADGEEGADAESNYEAIGGYYDGGTPRFFNGHFDGNCKTISGIRIYKDGTGYADYCQGIFGLTDSGADIHHLTLADARITGHDFTGGIVGYNNGGTVTRCHVAADVAVYAVQYNALYHGGIVGYNLGTIEQCTSAATLTTADADNSYCYGGIAGYNYGTLSDNLAIGATVPAAKDNTYGAITGDNNGGTLQRNYYTACKVAGTENATGVGCGHISDGNGGRIVADVTANNGAVSIHTLTLADGITTSTTATVTIGTTGYYAQGTAIALSYSGTTGDIPLGYQYGFTASAGTLNGSTLTMPAADVTVSVNTEVLRSTGELVEVSYVDAGGNTVSGQTAIALDGTESNLAAGWYFVGTDIAFDHTLSLSGDVHLILPDGCTMNVTSSNGNGIEVDSSLTIYGQTDGTGTLNATGENSSGIITNSGTITISGGTVTATCDKGIGISTNIGTITISGGRVTVTGGNEGIRSGIGNITISGGRVTVTGGYEGIHINSGTITLGCTTASDFIDVSSYFVGSLNITEYQTLCDQDGYPYSGNGVTIPVGKTLRLYGIDLAARPAPDGNYWTTYYNGTQGFTIGGNACAYTATYGSDKLTLNKLGKQIPAGTAVIIVAENSVVSMTATDLDAYTDDNDLHGVNTDTDVDIIRSALGDGTFYVLGMTTVNDEQHFGFHRYMGSTMAAHKAFVLVDNSQDAARSLTMVFDEATGIVSAEANSSLFTLHSSLSTWFTLDGRRLQAKPTAPGIYVNNGRKVVIK